MKRLGMSVAVTMTAGCVFALVSGLALEASAATWKGGDEGLWADANNWDGGVPSTSGEAVFTKSVKLTDTTSPTVKTLKFTGSGGYVLEGPTINLSTSALIQNAASARVTIKNNIVFTHNGWEGGQLMGSLQFDGTVSASNGYTMYPGGKNCDAIFNGKVDLGGGQLFLDSQQTLQFNAPANKVKLYMYNQVAVKMGCENAFDADSKILLLGHPNGGWGKLDLGGYNQRLTQLPATGSNGYVLSAADATLTLALAADDTNNNAIFQDKAGVMLEAEGKTLTLRATSTSTGVIGVRAGTLRVPGSWLSASILKVEGGTFELLHARTVGGSTAVEVTGGVLSVAEGVTESIKSLKLGGTTCTAGVWGSAESGAPNTSEFLAGKGMLLIAPETQTTAKWDAGGDTATGITTAANWEGDTTPDFANGGLTAVFDAGFVATIDTPFLCEGMSVTANTSGFTFAKDGDNRIYLLAKGLSVAAGSSERTVTVDAPVSVLQPQTWTVSGVADTLKVRGGISGASELAFSGGGKLALENAADYTGTLVFMPTAKSSLSLKDVDFAGALHVGHKTSETVLEHSLTLSGTNVIHKSATFRHWTTVSGPYNARLVVEGGLVSQSSMYMVGNATYVVRNKPISGASNLSWFSDNANRTELWAPTNTISFTHYNRSELHCKVRDALASGYQLRLGVSAFDEDRRGKLFITGDQKIGNFVTYPSVLGSGAQPVSSEEVSVLTVVNPTVNSDVYAEFLGGASFKFASVDGGNRTYTFHNASSSTGTVAVVGGTLDFAAPHAGDFTCAVTKKVHNIKFEGGSWKNASRVTVGGEPTIAAKAVLHHNRVFGKKTVIDLRESGTLDLAFEGTTSVGELWIDGVRQRDGVWGSAASGAPNQAACLSGTGQIRVGKVGFVMTVR